MLPLRSTDMRSATTPSPQFVAFDAIGLAGAGAGAGAATAAVPTRAAQRAARRPVIFIGTPRDADESSPTRAHYNREIDATRAPPGPGRPPGEIRGRRPRSRSAVPGPLRRRAGRHLPASR